MAVTELKNAVVLGLVDSFNLGGTEHITRGYKGEWVVFCDTFTLSMEAGRVREHRRGALALNILRFAALFVERSKYLSDAFWGRIPVLDVPTELFHFVSFDLVFLVVAVRRCSWC